MRWRRRIALILLTLAVAAGLTYGFWPKPRPVEVAVIGLGPLEESVDDEGITRVADRFVISAPVTGFAQRIGLDIGDAVRRGQTLATLEPMRAQALDPRAQAEAEARVAAARAAVQAAEAQAHSVTAEAELAASDLQRLVKLSQSQFVSEDKLEAARARERTTRASVRSAQFSVKVARYQLEAARTALAYTGQADRDRSRVVDITTPVSGQVLKVQHESEGVVTAGSPLIEIGDPRALEVAVDVLSADAVKIRPGMVVRFERWGGGQPLEGRVRTVEPVAFTKVSALGVEEQRVWVISDFTSDPQSWSRLGDGYRVEASFILWQGGDILQVPASALFRVKEGWAVYVVDHGTARQRLVVLGHRNGFAAQVLDGLKTGNVVITHPDETISDGVAVTYK